MAGMATTCCSRVRGTQVYGGPGQDTFLIELDPFETQQPRGALIKDFHHGDDILKLSPTGALDFSLDNQGDIWTLHYTSDLDGLPHELTFEISGITDLQPMDDYTFV